MTPNVSLHDTKRFPVLAKDITISTCGTTNTTNNYTQNPQISQAPPLISVAWRTSSSGVRRYRLKTGVWSCGVRRNRVPDPAFATYTNTNKHTHTYLHTHSQSSCTHIRTTISTRKLTHALKPTHIPQTQKRTDVQPTKRFSCGRGSLRSK